MLNIKEKLKNVFELFKDLLRKYTATVFVVIITTLLLAFCIDTDLDGKFLEVMFMFLVSYFAGTFFTESIFKKEKWKLIAYVISGGISLFFALYLGNFSSVPEFWMLFYIGYILVLMLMAIFSILKNSKLSFDEYITKVFSNLFFTSIIYGILALGISFICFIFIELLLDGDYDVIILRANILVFGFYYVIGCINAVSNIENKEINLFIKNLIKFVLMPLVGVAMAVIYLYILKILITREMPSNVIFRICAALFIVAYPTWNMFDSVKSKENNISKLFSYAYIPLLVLEIYSLVIRINSFGLTPTRYVGLFFIAFQVIALLLSLMWNKEKMPKLIVCVAILVAILTMTPFTPSKISSMSQLKILTSNLPEGISFDELSNDAKEKVKGAYRYLRYDDDNYKIPEYIKAYEETILKYNSYDNSRYSQYYYFNSSDRINVTGYNYVSRVYAYSPYNGVYHFNGSTEDFDIDEEEIYYYIKNLIDENNLQELMDYQNPNPYFVNDEITIYFTEIGFYYDKDRKELDVKHLEGYALER